MDYLSLPAPPLPMDLFLEATETKREAYSDECWARLEVDGEFQMEVGAAILQLRELRAIEAGRARKGVGGDE